ncbi:MAG: MotA/TolQ/ExbB proton channel family protein [Tissierellales bacterium]|jgi:hypothetical protein|nr:MotA/TolQ/ExbB proton channel family protein [Tissierellales bacterium]
MMEVIQQLNPVALFIAGTIVAILIIAFISLFITKGKYSALQADLDKRRSGTGFDEGSVVDNIIKDYRITAEDQYGDVNTQAIIERHLSRSLKGAMFGERFCKKAISLMIILGLLGTFYGLTLSIGDIVKVLGQSNNLDMFNSMEGIIDGLLQSIQGMSVAFVTSLFGITSAIILTIANLTTSPASVREVFMVDMEEYLDNTISLEFIKTESREYVEYVKIATKGMQEASQALLASVHKFESSLERFTDNTRDFSEFNHHLRNNIDRMSINFADMSDQFKTTAEKITAKSIEKY